MRKSVISLIIGFIIGCILLIVWINHLDFDFLLTSIKTINMRFAVFSGLLYIAAYMIRSYRWNLLLRNQVKVTMKESWLISSAGNWINYMIPIRAGEVLKAMLIKKLKHTRAVLIMPSIFIDKIFDSFGIFFILIAIPLIGIQMSKGLKYLISALISVLFFAFAILILASFYKKSTTSILKILFFWMPQQIREKIHHLIELFIDALNLFNHRYHIVIYCIILTVFGIILDGLYFYFVFVSFNIEIPLLTVIFGYTLINLSYVLPQPPAQLGSNEWMMIIIFSIGFGLTHNVASAIMVFAHIFTAIIITTLGVFSLGYFGFRSVSQIQRELK